MKNKVQENNDMLQIIINSIPQHIFWKNTESVFMGCNNNFAKIVGLTHPDEIIGKTDFDLTNREKAQYFIDIDKKVMKTSKAIYGMHELHKKSNGEEVWVNVNKVPLHDSEGNIVGIIGTFEDITDKISLSNKLQKNAQKYKTLIDKTNTAYIIMDTKLRIIETNEIFNDIMSVGSNYDIVGRNPRSWITTQDIEKFDEVFKCLLNEGIAINDLELNLLNDKGTLISVTISANIIENGGKRIFCLLRNISKRKVAEKAKYIEQQKTKDRLRQNIMEIRGKLRNIRAG